MILPLKRNLIIFESTFPEKDLNFRYPLPSASNPFAIRLPSLLRSHPSAIRSGFSSQGCSLNDFYNLHRYRDLLGLMCNMDHYEDFHGLFDDMEHNRD